jgi:hypothetical protein
LCGKRATRERPAFYHPDIAIVARNLAGTRQRNTALPAGSIDGEKKHKQSFVFLKCFIRADP